MNLKEQRAELLKSAREYQSKIENDTITREDVPKLKGILSHIKEIDAQLAKAAEKKPLLDQLGALAPGAGAPTGNDGPAFAQGKTGTALRVKAGELTRAMTRSVKAASGDGLTVSGSSVTDIPLVSTDPLVLPTAPTSLLDVLPMQLREQPSWQYLRQTVADYDAAFVPVGEQKPSSNLQVERVEGKLGVLATLSNPIDKYVLGDNVSLEQFVNGQLGLGIQKHLESEVIGGDGTSYAADGATYQHLTGLLHTDGVQSLAASVDDRALTLRAAVDMLEDQGHAASLFVLHPDDWRAIETQRNASGDFDLGGIAARSAKTLWSVPVVTTSGLQAGTALALDLSALSVDTDGRLVIDWDKSGSLFGRNQMQARVEGRFGLSVYRPAGIVVVNLVKTPASGA